VIRRWAQPRRQNLDRLITRSMVVSARNEIGTRTWSLSVESDAWQWAEADKESTADMAQERVSRRVATRGQGVQV